ncbi:DUF2336 domain-containing protein [Luteithermobacter gelatinilyticus]|uniref:DUF2336 domain-containing protein n=1 Tax=Luteithermobacter gelatinilyticus TaxID=2582913 RepID=UPI001106DABC|nr:DUF2336 domain-containing protein [Luteithermobacter gelatinilyticus]
MTTNLTNADVRKLLEDPSAENRAEAAQKVSTHFSSGKMTEAERKIAEDIFKLMVKDAEIRVRQALSASLKDNPDIPRDVAVTLASDVEEVSLPILEFSEVLTDEDLMELVAGSSAERQKAIARRNNLSADVADAIVENSDDEEVVATLVGNETAALRENTMEKVLDKFGESEKVNTPLAQRGQLPLKVAERLVYLVSEKVRDHLMTHHEMSPDMAMDLLLSARERATISLLGDGADVMDVRQLVDQLYDNGRLTHTLILRALCMGDLVFFEAAMAKLCRIPVSNAYKLIHDRGDLGLNAVFKQAKMPEGLHPLIRAALDVAKDMSVSAGEDRERFRSRMIERVLTYCENDVDPENLDYFITKLGNSGASEAA